MKDWWFMADAVRSTERGHEAAQLDAFLKELGYE